MIQEMERAIAKREQIAVRYKGKSEAAAGRNAKARGGVLVSGDGAGGTGGSKGGLGDLTSTTLKKKVRQPMSSCIVLFVRVIRYETCRKSYNYFIYIYLFFLKAMISFRGVSLIGSLLAGRVESVHGDPARPVRFENLPTRPDPTRPDPTRPDPSREAGKTP